MMRRGSRIKVHIQSRDCVDRNATLDGAGFSIAGAGASAAAAKAGVGDVADGVAEEVEAEHGEGDGAAGEDRGGDVVGELTRVADVVAPGDGARDAEAEEGQRGLGE